MVLGNVVHSLHHQIFVKCLLMPGYVLGTENPAMTLSNKQKEADDNQISKMTNATEKLKRSGEGIGLFR